MLNNLYIRTDYKCITVFGEVNHQLKCSSVRVRDVIGACIQDFAPLGMNRLVAVSTDALLSVYEFSLINHNYGLVGEPVQLEMSPKEIVTSLATCSLGKYLAVATKISRNSGFSLGRILLFKHEDEEISLLSAFDFRKTAFSKKPES